MRTTAIDGEPWFVAADVCRALELGNVSRAIERLDDDEGGLLEITHPQNPDKKIKVNIVNEPGLYTLVLGSRKPEAKAFKRWITHEVLPTLRKTGSYSMRDTGARLKEAAQILASCRHPKAIPALVAVLNEYTGVEIEAPGPIPPKTNPESADLVRSWIETKALTLDDILGTPATHLRRSLMSWLQINQIKTYVSAKAFCAIMRSIYGFDAKLRQGRASKWYFRM